MLLPVHLKAPAGIGMYVFLQVKCDVGRVDVLEHPSKRTDVLRSTGGMNVKTRGPGNPVSSNGILIILFSERIFWTAQCFHSIFKIINRG